MLNFIKKLWHARKHEVPFSFDKPLLVLQSDDWGRVGVRDKEGFEQLRQSGIALGEQLYDFYSLETAEDVIAIRDVLLRHRDSTGRSACMVMNFVMGNLDFAKMSQGEAEKIQILPLDAGLPGNWSRPGLFDAYKQGIADQVFLPALHGLTHFNNEAIERALATKGERRDLLRTLWKAETPYIHWRMPWVGYEYLNPEKTRNGFLPRSAQSEIIEAAVQVYRRFFQVDPLSACAPGYRANSDTTRAWAEQGIRVAQTRSEKPYPAYMDEYETLRLSRAIDFEPAYGELDLAKCLKQAEQCFSRGVPAIVSIHSINFHSSLKNFRGATLRMLDEFLSALESRHPDLLYAHDQDLYHLVTRGTFERDARTRVQVTQLKEVRVGQAVLEN